VNGVLTWLTDAGHWSGGEGIPLRVGQHLLYSGVALAIAALLAVPLGLWVGHTGRGRFLAVNLTGGLRAVPSLGLLSAMLQVVATATLAATVGLGGLGRFLIDGLAVRDYPQMAGGAVLVALLALLLDFAAGALQRLVVSPGLSQGPARKNVGNRRKATA
jgi:osmoprotectant transport system permease protein